MVAAPINYPLFIPGYWELNENYAAIIFAYKWCTVSNTQLIVIHWKVIYAGIMGEM